MVQPMDGKFLSNQNSNNIKMCAHAKMDTTIQTAIT